MTLFPYTTLFRSVERLKIYRYGLSDLASSDRFWNFYQDCQEEDSPCNFYPGCYVFDNGGLSSDVDKAIRLLFPGILVLVLLPMLVDYFNGCVRSRSLGTAAQIKIMGEPSLVFTGLWFGFYVRLPSGKYKIVKKKQCEDLEDLLVSFRLYFVIAGVSLCMSTMYYLLL